MRHRSNLTAVSTSNLLLGVHRECDVEQLAEPINGILQASRISDTCQQKSSALPALDHAPDELRRAGFHVIPWCKAVGFSRATFYNLKPTYRPKTVRVGRRLIVIETPEAYLQRIAELGDEAA